MIFFTILLSISLASFFITRSDIFPAYLISLPITFALAKERYCTPRHFKDIRYKYTYIDVSIWRYIFIGVLIFIQVHLPQNLSYETFEIGTFPVNKYPGAFQAVLIYISFIALTLLEYCNKEMTGFLSKYGKNNFLKFIGEILIVNPMILLMFVGIIFFAYEVAREIILYNIVCSYDELYCPS